MSRLADRIDDALEEAFGWVLRIGLCIMMLGVAGGVVLAIAVLIGAMR